MKNIGIIIFSYYKDEEFLALCLKGLLHTIRQHPQYNIKVFVVDDTNMERQIDTSLLPSDSSIEIMYSNFNRKGNLQGFDCMVGMVELYKQLMDNHNLDFIMKFDSDCVLNDLTFIDETEEFLKKRNVPFNNLLQIGSAMHSVQCQGCAQMMTKQGVYSLFTLFYNMIKGDSKESVILKKRVEFGFYEDKMFSLLLEMVPNCFRFNIRVLPNCLGHLDCYTNPNADFTKYTTLNFKGYSMLKNQGWSDEKAYEEMKKYIETHKQF